MRPAPHPINIINPTPRNVGPNTTTHQFVYSTINPATPSPAIQSRMVTTNSLYARPTTTTAATAASLMEHQI
eukprot:UN01045